MPAFRRLGEVRVEPDPTPEEIAAACLEIRQGWSEQEHRIRAGERLVLNWSDVKGREYVFPVSELPSWEAPRCRVHGMEVLR